MIQLERPAELVARLQRFAALADRREAAVPAAELRDFAGEYKFFNRSIAISLKNDRLWLGLPDTPDKPLFAASNSRFFVRTTETEFQFERDPAGKVVKLVIFNADGNKIECPRRLIAGPHPPTVRPERLAPGFCLLRSYVLIAVPKLLPLNLSSTGTHFDFES